MNARKYPEKVFRIIIAAGVLGLLAGCSIPINKLPQNLAAEYRENVSKDIPAGNIRVISITEIAGYVKVKPAQGKKIAVRATKVFQTPTLKIAKKHSHEVDVKIDLKGETLSIHTGHPKLFRSFSYSVNYEVEVPRGVSLDVKTVNGSIEIAPGAQSVTAASVRGRISIKGVGSGGVNSKNVSGRIIIEGVNGGELSVINVKGPVAVSGKPASAGIKTVSGSIDFTAEIPPTGNISLDSVSGPINASFPAMSDLAVSVFTTSGYIESELPLKDERRSRHSLSGKLTDGKYTAKIKTISSDVSLKKSPYLLN